MKKWADDKRRHVEINAGDLVMVKILPTQHKSTRPLHKGLVRKYEGPFPIAKRVGKVSYKVDLPSRLRLHPVFHASCLKPYHGDAEDTERGPQSRAPLGVSTSYDKEAELILDVRIVRKKNYPPSREYFVKWKGLPDSETSWEPENALWQFEDKVREFQRRRDEGVA